MEPWLDTSALDSGVVQTFCEAAGAPTRCEDCGAWIRRESYGKTSLLVNAAFVAGRWLCPTSYHKHTAGAKLRAAMAAREIA